MKKAILGILIVLMMALTACSNNASVEPAAAAGVDAVSGSDTVPAADPGLGGVETAAPAEPGDVVADTNAEPTATTAQANGSTPALSEDYPNAIPMFMQLVLGTMLLEGTPNAATAEQAQDLLPKWQMFRAVRSGNSPPSMEEINAALNPILEAMTPGQLVSINEMQLTQDDMRAFTQANGIVGQGQGASSGDSQTLSDEERRARMATQGGTALVGELIKRLEIWAG